jgi:Zn finger protein HypA/HybF involved in hydrogenase expression
MHDFMLAKEIVDEVLKIAKEKNLSKINRVSVEIGQIALAHDGHEEHVEDISIENLQFGIDTIAKGTLLENAKFDIIKINGENWKLVGIEGET